MTNFSEIKILRLYFTFLSSHESCYYLLQSQRRFLSLWFGKKLEGFQVGSRSLRSSNLHGSPKSRTSLSLNSFPSRFVSTTDHIGHTWANYGQEEGFCKYFILERLGTLRAPTSSWRPSGLQLLWCDAYILDACIYVLMMHVSMMYVSMMYVSMMYAYMMQESTHAFIMLVSMILVSVMHVSTMHISMIHVSMMYVPMVCSSMMLVSIMHLWCMNP